MCMPHVSTAHACVLQLIMKMDFLLNNSCFQTCKDMFIVFVSVYGPVPCCQLDCVGV